MLVADDGGDAAATTGMVVPCTRASNSVMLTSKTRTKSLLRACNAIVLILSHTHVVKSLLRHSYISCTPSDDEDDCHGGGGGEAGDPMLTSFDSVMLVASSAEGGKSCWFDDGGSDNDADDEPAAVLVGLVAG